MTRRNPAADPARSAAGGAPDWDPAEDEILVAHYGPRGYAARVRAALAAAGWARDLGAIYRRASDLDLTPERASSGEPYSPAELEILRRWYPLEGGAVAERLPGRSRRGCQTEAQRLGIAYADSPAERLRRGL